MQNKPPQFNMQALFDSLSPEEQERINCAIKENAQSRERERYARLQAAEIAKNEVVQEIERVGLEIAQNDDWFVAAKQGKVEVAPEALSQHRRKAEELYRQNSALIHRLSEAASSIKWVISQIEADEAQEPAFQRRDLERLLLPLYEERERERRQTLIARAKERRRQREKEEAERQEEYDALLSRLRAQEAERRRILAEQLRKQRADGIRARVHGRKIPYLVHFTPLGNMESILRNGLRSRNALCGREYIFTDEHRSDGWLDWISVSVSFPNYKMLYTKRNSLKNIDGWGILLLKREVLWELDCKFVITNAASFGIRMFGGYKWSSVEAFEDMFGHAEHRICIPDWYTTDPQAEVMVRDEVPRHYIDMVILERQLDAERLGSSEGLRLEIRPEFFKWRSDFEHWRQFRLSPFPVDKGQLPDFSHG